MMIAAGLALAVLGLLAPRCARAASYQVTLSTVASGAAMADPFSCYQDQVYASIKLPKPASGKHLLEGKWYKPDHSLQEDTKVPLQLDADQDSFFLWLQFHVVDDAVDMFLARPDDSFDGSWLLVLYWDGKEVAERRFAVRCG